MDLRNHRKLVVIDGETAYIGSQNLVDPHLFKQSEGVGEWIDAMARVRGPVVEAFAVAFAADWELETGEGVEKIAAEGAVHTCAVRGGACAQLVPSGPGLFAGVFHAVLLSAIYQAREELIFTTPYFVPDEPMRAAIVSAARRGVKVLVVVPQRVDSRLVAAASRSHFIDLLDAGVEIAQYRSGMLHTKAIVVDGRVGMIGTVNLDNRSFYLNFEVTLVVYDRAFALRLREQQLVYAARSERLDARAWRERPFLARLAENSTGLLAPLL
jgi:cardiolipin synthase